MIEEKIQLTHPAGKKAVRMDKGKYDILKNALLQYLKAQGSATQTEIWNAVTEDFQEHKIAFEGAVPWHLEWVKLDLESNKIIERIPGTAPQKYAIVQS